MRIRNQILPGVRRVGTVCCPRLPAHVELTAICGLRVPLMAEVEPVPVCGEAVCRCVGVRAGAAVSETATLTFRSSMPLDIGAALAFVVEDVEGRCWLIGAREAPFPRVERTSSVGVPGGDPAGESYEVTHSAIRTMVECVTVWPD